MRIRKARKEDAVPISRLGRLIVDESPFYNEEWKRKSRRQMSQKEVEKRLEDRMWLHLVATEGDRVLGYCFGNEDGGALWLEWIMVHPEARRRGVAQALLGEVERQSRRRGWHKVWCDTRTNNAYSVPLFRRLGYRRAATLKKHWCKLDFHLWEKNL